MKILLMEDDPVLGDIITEYLEDFYTTHRAFDSAQAQEMIERESYDLFIFDINVPGQSGIELLRELRAYNNTTPAIILTAYHDTAYLKESFDAGAHDYIKKPFELEELRLRIDKSKVLFFIDQEEPIAITDSLSYFAPKKLLLSGTQEILLKPKEAALLEYFIQHPQRLISQEELIQNIWEYDAMPSNATLRSHIRHLREAVGSEKIVTYRGLGYRFE